MTQNIKRDLYRWWAVILILSLGLASCRASSPTATVDGPQPGLTPSAQSAVATSTAPQDAPPTTTPTPTPQPALAVLLAPPGSDSALAERMFKILQPNLEQAGLRWELRPALDAAGLDADLRLVVVLPPDPGLAALAAAAPQAQFLAVGIPGLQPAANISLVGSQGARPDQQGFIAGVIAAAITPDWRVGVLGPGDSPAARAARQGFLNGAIYFCGLCLPYHGPTVDYPVFLDLPAGAGPAEIQAAVQGLKDLAVQTVYIVPGSLGSDLTGALAQAGVNVLGAGTPPPELAQQWVASVDSDPLPAILDLLPALLAGQGEQSLEMSLSMTNANQDLFSQGRQERVQEILADLLAGFIDTGVDPASGEPR